MIADDLSFCQCVATWRDLWAAGHAGGRCYVERSEDSGSTKANLPGGVTALPVLAETVTPETPGLWFDPSQRLWVAVNQDDAVRVLVSDRGGLNFGHFQTLT